MPRCQNFCMRLLIYDEGMYVYTRDDVSLLLYNWVGFGVRLGSAEKHELSGQRSQGGGGEGCGVRCMRSSMEMIAGSPSGM